MKLRPHNNMPYKNNDNTNKQFIKKEKKRNDQEIIKR